MRVVETVLGRRESQNSDSVVDSMLHACAAVSGPDGADRCATPERNRPHAGADLGKPTPLRTHMLRLLRHPLTLARTPTATARTMSTAHIQLFPAIKVSPTTKLSIAEHVPHMLTAVHPTQPYKSELLAVSDVHKLSIKQYGNPEGVPLVHLHGGPGGGCDDQVSGGWHLRAGTLALAPNRAGPQA